MAVLFHLEFELLSSVLAELAQKERRGAFTGLRLPKLDGLYRLFDFQCGLFL